MIHADLTGADLTDVNLTTTDLTEAILGGAKLPAWFKAPGQ